MAGKRDKTQPELLPVANVLGDGRPQPHNIEAERAVISAMLREPETCVDMVIESLQNEKAFYLHQHQMIVKSIMQVHRETQGGADILTVANDLRKHGKLEEIGGELALIELHDAISTSANLENWCGIVGEFAMLRRMIDVCSESLLNCMNPSETAARLIDDIEAKIFEVRFTVERQDIIDIKDSIKDTFNYLLEVMKGQVEVGLKTGLPDLDRMTFGFKPGEMFVLAARPSIGKTSIALNIIRNVALRNDHPPIAFFSLEMTADQITRRLVCTEADVPESNFYNGKFQQKDLHKLTTAVNQFKQANIFIDPTPGITIAELRAKARRLKAQHGIKLIAIDYLQLMKGDRLNQENRQQEVAEISGGIKSMAKDLNVPVLVLAQLNRDVEKTGSADARPKLSHLRESGSIEQDADIVTFLHRRREDSKNVNEEMSRLGLEAELIVEKNRNGQTGTVKLKFFPHRMEFVNVTVYDEKPEGL